MPDAEINVLIRAPNLILFDLDGTFADTAPDLAHALNHVLAQYQRPPLPFESIRPVVSLGGTALVSLGFDMGEGEPGFAERRQRFLDVYLNDIAGHTSLFPGINEVLQHIEETQRRWGIVTNKPGWLTNPLMTALALSQRASCIVSGDTLPQRKPHPAPILHACELAGNSPGESLYIGDARRDVQAGHGAGVPVIVARYGYIPKGEDPETWGADAMIDSPLDLLDCLDWRD
jgi:2-phosphoglycolate phosphatase